MDDIRKLVAGKVSALAEKILRMQVERQPDLEKRYGQAGLEICRQDIQYHLFYLAEALSLDSPLLFEEYMSWVKSLLQSLGIPADDMMVNLQCMRDVLRRELPREYAERADDLLDEMYAKYPSLRYEVEESYLGEGPFADLARSYLETLLEGKRRDAGRMIMEAVEQGAEIKELYLHVFQPVQWELGRLWQLNRISVAQEHYCTAATQLVMSQLYPYIFKGARVGAKLVAACAANELHEIGLRMVSDILEMEGWDTYYLGANVPGNSVLRAVRDIEPRVLALSATITYNVGEMADLIQAVRENFADTAPKIAVGGYPFKVDRDLWKKVGADLWAPDAESALAAIGGLAGR
jgi:methanogenic corrinoid protein MtbC1